LADSKTVNTPVPPPKTMTKAGFLKISKEAQEILSSDPYYRKLAEAAVEAYVRRLIRMDELTRGCTMTDGKAIGRGRAARRGIHRRITGD
jgi:hypothetical protein